MSNGTKRNRVLGIASQSLFATPAASATYWLPVMDYETGEEVSYIENEAATGSNYRVNDAVIEHKQAKPSFTIKISEAEFPILLKSFGTVLTTLVAGETTVYQHVVTFTNSNDKALYTLFLDDPDRQDLIFSAFRIETMSFTHEKGSYLTVEITGTSKFPANATITPSLTEWLEFTSQHSVFKIADEGGSLATVKLLSASAEYTFGITDDEDNFYLGDVDLGQSFNTEAEFTQEVTLHFPDLTYKNKWSGGTRQRFSQTITDTNRIITGSITSVSPSIVFDHPSAYLSEWAEDGDMGDILKQTMSLMTLDRIGVADAPVKITVINGVASYA